MRTESRHLPSEFRMLTCYLDESGSDSENPILTIAGYVGRESGWMDFEAKVEPWFAEYGVTICHAKELHSGRNEFKNWTVLRKQSFVSRLCMARNKCAMMGLSMSTKKDVYSERAATSTRARTVTPYTFCFNVVIDRILRDISVGLGRTVHAEGLRLILEDGHRNAEEARAQFADIRVRHNVENVLVDLQFVPKTSSRAIQLADLLAFYSRRNGVALLKAKEQGAETYPIDTMDRLLVEGMPHWSMVATDFDNWENRSPMINLPRF
jgi:hypothetical protein